MGACGGDIGSYGSLMCPLSGDFPGLALGFSGMFSGDTLEAGRWWSTGCGWDSGLNLLEGFDRTGADDGAVLWNVDVGGC